MKEQVCQILRNEKIAEDVFLLDLQVKDYEAAEVLGKFVEIKLPDGAYVLRRPISIHDFNEKTQVLTLIYKILGAGTDFLAKQMAGTKIAVLGPLGHGFPLPTAGKKHCLLIGGGVGVPPLYALGKALVAQGHQVTTILGFRDAASVFKAEAFAELGAVHLATEDGSVGIKGFVTSFLNEELKAADVYYSCGPIPMLKALEANLPDMEGWLSFEARMACGLGACYGCVVETQTGLQRVCADGPVFAAGEVVYGGI